MAGGPYLEKDSRITVVHALVTSRLDYCNELGLAQKMVWKLQLVRKSAARLLTESRGVDHIIPILAQLHWLPVSFQAQFKMLGLTYKVSGLQNLKDHFPI